MHLLHRVPLRHNVLLLRKTKHPQHARLPDAHSYQTSLRDGYGSCHSHFRGDQLRPLVHEVQVFLGFAAAALVLKCQITGRARHSIRQQNGECI
jgi:hypothetical protein